MKQVARRSALTYKANDGDITLLEELKFDSAKTKDFISLEKALNVTDNKSLFVLAENDKNLYLSSRNLKKSKVLLVNELNTYSVLNADKLIITENAIAKLNDLLG